MQGNDPCFKADMWKAINGLLGLQKDRYDRYYLGAPHPAFVERVGDKTIPMLWADSIDVEPLDDFYTDPDNPQVLNFKNVDLHVSYSNDSIHYSRIKCSWTPRLEQEYIQVGSLFWKDKSKTGINQYNTDADFLALPTQKYSRRVMTADIQYSVAFYMNPQYPGCLPEWCDMAVPLTGYENNEEAMWKLKKLWGAVNNSDIELFPYFGDPLSQEMFVANIGSNNGVFCQTDDNDRPCAAPAGTLMLADVSCSTEFRPWIFGNPLDNTSSNKVGLRQMPLTFLNFRLAYRCEGWNKFWNGLRMEYGDLWWQDAREREGQQPERRDVVLFEPRDFTPIQTFIRNNISWDKHLENSPALAGKKISQSSRRPMYTKKTDRQSVKNPLIEH